MGRASRAEAQAHREEVVTEAARLFRERGIEGVSVADVMAAAGLTHGGFYRQFQSKEALVAEATTRAFEELQALLGGFDADNPADHAAAREALVRYYLTPAHRDNPGEGCPATGLGASFSRGGESHDARERYAGGVEGFARWLATAALGGDSAPTVDLVTTSTLVGALTLARATAGAQLSDDILRTVGESLLAQARSADPA